MEKYERGALQTSPKGMYEIEDGSVGPILNRSEIDDGSVSPILNRSEAQFSPEGENCGRSEIEDSKPDQSEKSNSQ